MNIEGYELPTIFKYHVFVCCQSRPPGHPRGSCGACGAAPLWERLSSRIQALGSTEVSLGTTGCMGFCNAGPLMVVYPEGVWYRPETTEDIDRIVSSHFGQGEPVTDLVVVLKQ